MKKRNLIIFLFSMIFALIMILVVLDKCSFIDNGIYNFIISNRCDVLDHYFKFITRLGNYKTVIAIVLVLAIIFHNRYSFYLGINVSSSVLLNTFFKQCIRRDRPNLLRLIEQGGYSFPSGHAMISICLYGYLFYLSYTKINNKFLKYGVSILLFLIIISIGVSRIYLGVHYASDVIAGYLLATNYVMLFIVIVEKFESRGR